MLILKSVRNGNVHICAKALEDAFTAERYEQFHRFLPRDAIRILDVGCATGRGGVRLKELRPNCELAGLDCVSERLDELPACYAAKILGLDRKTLQRKGF